MNTIEALASGVPVVAVAEGGFLETMIHGETGILLAPNHSDEDLAQAVEGMTREKSQTMVEACISRAELFSLKTFEKKLLSLVQENNFSDTYISTPKL